MQRKDIRLYFLKLTRDNVKFREMLQHLVDSGKIFQPENAWLLKQVMQYAFGVPAPLEEDLHDMNRSLVFLSQNPIGRPEFDPLANAKVIGPRALSEPDTASAFPEPDAADSPTALDASEVEAFQPPPEPVPRIRPADYR